jgi:predicted DNA-binding transcriptional regulator YafY
VAKSSASLPDERILQLLLLLLDANRDLSRAEIFDAIPRYRTAKPSAGERKFERDKKDLRDLGVPLRESEEDPHLYSVDRRDYELPRLTLAPDERAALVLAAEALRGWRGIGYRDLVEEALRKLSFDGPGGSGRQAPAELAVALPSAARGRRARLTIAELTRAVEKRKRVTLLYRSANDESTTREVDPYAVVYSAGDWHLVGHCRLRNAPRTFRIDRAVRVTVASKPGTPDFERPRGWSLTTYVNRSPWGFHAGDGGGAEVVLDVAPERSWVADEDFGANASRESVPGPAASDGTWTRVRFRTGNAEYVVTRVLDAAGYLRVAAPGELVARVREKALAVATLYREDGR